MSDSSKPSASPLAVTASTIVTAQGRGKAAHIQAMTAMHSGLRDNDFSIAPLSCHIGRVAGLEDITLPETLRGWDCRNNRLAWLALNLDGFDAAVAAARTRYGAERIALLVGTSTGSIDSTEEAYRRLDDHHLPEDARRPPIHCLHSLGGFLGEALSLAGPALTVSTACSSSAKVFAMAERMIRSGVVDAAVVGGVDSLCHSVLFGFNSLQLVSDAACQPFDVSRKGISIGEGAGLALLERAQTKPDAPRLAGWGESSDAWHMSTPHPEGLGAELAIDEALKRAGLCAEDVDYINLHGTATRHNDAVEAELVHRLFPARVRASSTKGGTGHTLGAAGAVEAVFSLLAMEHGMIPGTIGCSHPEPVCAPQLVLRTQAQPVRVALSNSFGFGGNNACLVFVHGSCTP